MTFTRDEAFAGWCCTDCLFLLANGDTPAEMGETETAEYLARVEHYCAGHRGHAGHVPRGSPVPGQLHRDLRANAYSRRRLTVEVLADDIEDARYAAELGMLPAGARVSSGTRAGTTWPPCKT